MKTFTISDIRKLNPCYDPAKYIPENWSGTVIDIVDIKACPFEERLWVILRTDFISEKLMRLFAVWCARQLQHLMTDERSLLALDVMEAYAEWRWLIDDPDWAEAWESERAAAWDAARSAPWDAARDAARDATWSAAWDAARDAARDAAWDATWDAARGAARSAPWDAARGAAWDAAWDATWDAARGAAWDADRGAAWDATWDATWDAARGAAWDAARDAQEAQLRKMIIAGVETGDTK